jgi:hypothetical protein
MAEEYVRQHPYTKLGEDAVEAVGKLSMALDNAYDIQSKEGAFLAGLREQLRNALEDTKNLRERYAELQAKSNYGLVPKYMAERNEALLRAEEAEKGKEGWQKRAEQAELQLAACGVAATGWAKGKDCKQGDYGWSASFADTLALRKRFEQLEVDRNDWKNASDSWRYKCESAEAKVRLLTPKPAGLYIQQDKVYKSYPEPAECGLTVAEQVEGLRSKVAELERKLG